jgi:hypothetical protein
MKKSILKFATLGTLIFLGLSSCKKDENKSTPTPVTVNEEELVTDLIISLTDSSDATKTYSAAFRDEDGFTGSKAATIDSLKLPANKTFNFSLILLDKSKSPVDTISNEILEEADVHQFFFKTTPTAFALEVVSNSLNKDSRNLPLGLTGKIRTGAISGSLPTGQLNIKLYHFDNANQKNGTSTSSETDIELDFPVRLW